jgi:hypothetical protein
VALLADATASGGHLNDPAGAYPGIPDVLRRLIFPQRPGDDPPVAFLVIDCHESDLVFPMELAANLLVEGLLVGSLLRGRLRLHRQEEVGPLLMELSKTERWVRIASA